MATPKELYSIIRTELTTDPLGLGYSQLKAKGAVGSIETLINTINDAYSVAVQPVQRRDIKQLLWGNFKLMPIYASSADSALAAKTLFTDPDFPTIDTSNKVWIVLRDALLADGLLDGTDSTALDALALRKASRAEVLLGAGSNITAAQIVEAMDGKL